MNMPMCSRCKKNIAVVFITKIEGPDKTTQEGLCLKCARELGVKPLDNIMEQMGITEDDLEALSGEIGSPVRPERPGSRRFGRHGRRRTPRDRPGRCRHSAGAARRRLSGGDPHPFFPQGGQKAQISEQLLREPDPKRPQKAALTTSWAATARPTASFRF